MHLFSKRSLVVKSANAATALFILAALLQVMLALGILPVTMAWGGTETELSTGLRIASLAAGTVLVMFMYIIRRRAGLTGEPPVPTYIKFLSWVVTVLMIVNTLGNLSSSSIGERLLFAPITILLAITCFVVSAYRMESP